MDPTSDEVLTNKRFVKHAKYFVQMIDRAISLLGPEVEMLTEILLELGEKHSRYGVKPEFFPSMGRALMEAISFNLGEGEFAEVKTDWIEVYGALSYDMALNKE
jgi:hemoglobin-like flavoprotein